LTAAAKTELPTVVSGIVLNREKWFLDFFNTARAVTPRMHALELIPGIGKKYMWQVVNERDKKLFENFDDLQKRTELPNPVKLITKRVLEELSGDSKYRLFTRAH
jgi:putative nucleotide binding protein